MSEQFIGRGWSYPLHTNRTGGIALVGREQEIEESIRLILATSKGERPMRPEFGCGIHDYVFSPVDAQTAGYLAFEVTSSLAMWEPRISVESVDILVDPDDPARLFIDISYQLAQSNDPRNLVFPFYLIPTEADSTAPIEEPR